MEKQTKNILTRELIEKELRFNNTAGIRSSSVLCGTMALLFVPITALCIYGVVSLSGHLFIKILFCILFGGLMSSPVWLNLVSLFYGLAERKRLSAGEFDIVTREVLYKSEKLVRRHTEEYLHFDGFREVMVGHTVFQLTSSGDEFYIVHYRNQKTVRLLYSSKMYEYR